MPTVMGLVTNRGRFRLNNGFFVDRNGLPATLHMQLCTTADVPTVDTHNMGELTEIDAGNGYDAGGVALDVEVDFQGAGQDDVNDRSDVVVADVEWVATGGDLPATGDPARYAVLTCEGADAERDVFAAWDLGADYSKLEGESLVLSGFAIRLKLPAT
jgi:hypothetical protein